MKKIDSYEWCEVWADERDPNAGGASYYYLVVSRDATTPDYPTAHHCENMAHVRFQHDPRALETSRQGCLDDHILAIVQDRMEAFQAGPFPHALNAKALEGIMMARAALRERAEERRARGVLGKNEP